MPAESVSLVCLGCGARRPLGPEWWGCDQCVDAAGFPHWLEVAYLLSAVVDVGRAGRLWDYADLLPVAPEHRVTLGEGGTPLVRLDGLNAAVGVPGLHLKLEPVNPTGSFKDRSQAVAISMAKQLGFDRAVIASTGNAGVACAAMGAAGGVGVAVVLDPGASAEQRRLVELLGAQVVVPDGDGPVIAQAGSVVSALVRSHRFAPCTIQGTFAGPANPYGVEGYKTIAFELVAQLGRVPDRVCVPTAAGDALYGIYKGFRELAERGLTDGVPRMTACQPAGAGFVAAALSSGASTFEPVVPDTFAISIGDPSGSTSILEAVRSSGGTAWTAGDEALLDAMALMARSGVIAEGASAAPVAALAAAAADCADELVVAVVTGSGLKWQDQLEQALVRRGRLAPLPGDAAVVAAAMS